MTVDLTIVLPVVIGLITLCGILWGIFSYLGSLKDRITTLEVMMVNIQRERNDDVATYGRIFKQLKEISDKLDTYNSSFRDQQLRCIEKFVTKDNCESCRREP